jgi:CRP-like cAMP-binding protein
LSDGRRLMVPNHVLTSNPVMNHSRPQGAKRLCVEVPVANGFPAERAQAILLAEAYRAVRARPLSAQRDPDVLIDHFGSDAVCFHVRFYADLEESDPQTAKSIMALAVHRALLRHRVPSPISQMELVPAQDGAGEGEEEARSALGHVPIFTSVLGEAQLDALVKSCEVRALAAGADFISQRETGSSMFVILEGAARVSIALPDGEVREVAVLAAGDIVGEMSLMTGAPRAASVKSLTTMRVLEVTKAAIEPLLAAQPGLLERFSDVLAARQSGLSEIASTPGQKQALQNDILAQMRRFFSRAFR